MGEAAEREAGSAGASSGTALAVQPYDFRQPSRISKDRLRSLRAIYGMMSKAVEGWLTGRVRGHMELDVTSVDQRGFGELVLSMPSPCCSYVYDVADSGGQQILIDFDANLCFFLIDRLLGGSGEGPVPPRPLTMIERSVVRIVADRVAAELVESWKEHVRLGLTLSRFESIPDMLQIANREEPILVTELVVRAGELEGRMRLCLPFAVLEKFFGGASQRRLQAGRGSEAERAADRQGVESAVRASRVQVCARLPLFEVRLGTLMRLRPGDVLETGLNPDVAIEVLLNGQNRLRARAGRVGRRLALQMLDWVGPDGGQPSVQTTRGRTH